MAIDVGRIFCDYGLVDGTPASGTVWVSPVNYSTDGDLVVVPVKIPLPVEVGVLDDNVYFDSAEVTPDLYLQIEERIDGAPRRAAYIIRPEGLEINLATATRYEIGPINPGPGEPVPGPAGEAATVQVGSTTTGAPGTNALVVNSGTTSAAVLDFTIPRGTQGIQGIQGDPGADGVDGVDGVDANMAWVTVVTGDEVRPATTNVLWVGGLVQPTNMAVGDVWLKETL